MTHKAVPNRPLIVKAGEYNDAMEAGQWFAKQKALGASPAVDLRQRSPVRVKNTTGGTLSAGSVVELSPSSLTALDRNHLWFNGASRSGAHPPFAVLLESCPYNDYGEAVTCGEVLALVDVQDTDNTHGRFTSGGTTFKGCFGGPVELLTKPTSTGSQLLPVRIGATQTIVRRAKAAADIASGASGNVNVYLNGSSKGTITAYNDWDAGDVANNDELRIAYHHDLDRWDIVKRGGSGSTPPVQGCIRVRLGGGSGLVYANGSSSSMSSPYTIDQYGIWLFPGSVEGISTNSLGTIFTAPTPTAYYDNAIEVGQKNHYMVTLHTTWRLPPETLSSARLRFRAASHTHDYTDNGGAMVTGATSPDARALDDGVNVQVASYITDGLGTSQFAGMSSTNLWYGSDDYRYCHHTGVADIICTSTLLHMRFKVVRNDANSYGAPELHSAYALIQQVGTPTL